MLSCIHPDYRDVTMSMDDWRLSLTLEADRKCRVCSKNIAFANLLTQAQREEWEAQGGGVPDDHQYIVAYEAEEATYSYLRTFISCFVG